MKLIKLSILVVITIFIVACASGPKFTQPTQPTSGKSAIYIYRPWVYWNGAASPIIQLDGVGEEKLVNGSFLRMETSPGQHKIAIAERFDWVSARTWPNVGIDITSEPDKEYYVRFSTAGEIIPGYFTIVRFDFAFQLVPKDIALKELVPEHK
jgi:hypothetical protein